MDINDLKNKYMNVGESDIPDNLDSENKHRMKFYSVFPGDNYIRIVPSKKELDQNGNVTMEDRINGIDVWRHKFKINYMDPNEEMITINCQGKGKCIICHLNNYLYNHSKPMYSSLSKNIYAKKYTFIPIFPRKYVDNESNLVIDNVDTVFIYEASKTIAMKMFNKDAFINNFLSIGDNGRDFIIVKQKDESKNQNKPQVQPNLCRWNDKSTPLAKNDVLIENILNNSYELSKCVSYPGETDLKKFMDKVVSYGIDLDEFIAIAKSKGYDITFMGYSNVIKNNSINSNKKVSKSEKLLNEIINAPIKSDDFEDDDLPF